MTLIINACSMDDNLDSDQSDSEFVLNVQGAVTDKLTDRKLQGIRIVLSSFDPNDIVKGYPISTDTTYSDASGNYSLSINCSTTTALLKAEDVDDDNAHYRSAYHDIVVNFDGLLYDAEDKTYNLYGINLPMDRQ